MASKSGPDIIEDGLVLCLDAASKRSYPGAGTTWTDLKGSNNGTLTNGPTFDAGNGGSIVFDGANDSVSFSSLPAGFQAGMTNYTISIWFKLISRKEGPLLEMGNTNADYKRIMFWLTNDSPKNRLYALGADNNSYRYSSVYLDLNTVYNSVYTYNNTGTVSKLYIDSIEDTGLSGQTTNGLLTELANTWRIGADSVYNQSYTQNANVYNVSLYTKTLTADEIRRNYLSTKERFA